jgi:hypothetical protein
MSIPAVWPQILDFFGTPLGFAHPASSPATPACSPPASSTERIGLTRTFAEAVDGPRAKGTSARLAGEIA